MKTIEKNDIQDLSREKGRPQFITLGPEHVGKCTVQAFGYNWFVGPIRPEDTGRRLYYVNVHEVQLESDEDMVDRESYPTLMAIWERGDLMLLQDEDDDTYAVGMPVQDGNITPWFETKAELEEFCKRNKSLFPQLLEN